MVKAVDLGVLSEFEYGIVSFLLFLFSEVVKIVFKNNGECKVLLYLWCA